MPITRTNSADGIELRLADDVARSGTIGRPARALGATGGLRVCLAALWLPCLRPALCEPPEPAPISADDVDAGAIVLVVVVPKSNALSVGRPAGIEATTQPAQSGAVWPDTER